MCYVLLLLTCIDIEWCELRNELRANARTQHAESAPRTHTHTKRTLPLMNMRSDVRLYRELREKWKHCSDVDAFWMVYVFFVFVFHEDLTAVYRIRAI